jgi:hypothetical protein
MDRGAQRVQLRPGPALRSLLRGALGRGLRRGLPILYRLGGTSSPRRRPSVTMPRDESRGCAHLHPLPAMLQSLLRAGLLADPLDPPLLGVWDDVDDDDYVPF